MSNTSTLLSPMFRHCDADGLHSKDTTRTQQSSSLFCICCLETEVPYICLTECSHADFLNSMTAPKVNLENKVVCYLCHSMLKKIMLFKLQIEESFKLINNEVHIPKSSNQRHNLKIHKEINIDIPEINSIEEQKTTNMNNIIETEQNTVEKSTTPKSLTNNKIKNIEDALKIINNNQNNGCANLLATSLQSLTNSILTDNFNILNFKLIDDLSPSTIQNLSDTPNDLKPRGKIATNDKSNSNNGSTAINNTSMSIDGALDNESKNNINHKKDEFNRPVIMTEENFNIRNVQMYKSKIDVPPLNSNIERVILTREQLIEERCRTAVSPSYLRSPYHCGSCLLGYHYEENLKDHIKRKHTRKEGVVTCDVCLQSMSPGPSYDEHLSRHYIRYKCHLCGQQFDLYEKANFHYRRKHSKSVMYRCRHCPYKTIQRLKLRDHLKIHSKCKTCGVSYVLVKKLRKNMKSRRTLKYI